MVKKVVVITGASSGLGKELARICAKKGYALVLSGRNKDQLKEFEKNKRTDIIIGDITLENTLNQIRNVVIKKHKRVDVLINNAGVVFIQPFEANTKEQLDLIMEVDVKSHIRLTQKLYPVMKKQKSGHIINIISTAGMEAKYNHTLYCTAKFALRGFTESLRLEAKKYKIKVTGVYPGGMKTNMFNNLLINQNTFMNPGDVANAIYKITELGDISPDSFAISRMAWQDDLLYGKVK